MFNLIDLDTKMVGCVSGKELAVTLSRNPEKVENAALDSNGKIVGTKGKLESYGVIGGRNAFVILEEIRDEVQTIGYTYCDCEGRILKSNVEHLINIGSLVGIANARVCTSTYKTQYIAPIKGKFRSVKERNYKENLDEIARRLRMMAECIDTKQINRGYIPKYNIMTKVVIESAELGFNGVKLKEYSQIRHLKGIYQHRNGATSQIVVEGFYVDESKKVYTTSVTDALREMAKEVERFNRGKGLPVIGISDTLDNIKKLSSMDMRDLYDTAIIPIIVVLRSDFNGKTKQVIYRELLKPIYSSREEFQSVLSNMQNRIEMAARKFRTDESKVG